MIFFANMFCGIWDHVSNFGELIKHLYNFKKFNEEPADPVEDAIPLYKKCNIKEYYEKILSLHFPQNIKKYNLELFIKYNLLNVLPTYNCLIKDTSVYIYNENNICIIHARII